MKIDRWILEVHQQRRHRCRIRRRVGIPGQTSGGAGGASVRGNIFPSGIYMAERADKNMMSCGTESRARQCLAMDFRRGEVFGCGERVGKPGDDGDLPSLMELLLQSWIGLRHENTLAPYEER